MLSPKEWQPAYSEQHTTKPSCAGDSLWKHVCPYPRITLSYGHTHTHTHTNLWVSVHVRCDCLSDEVKGAKGLQYPDFFWSCIALIHLSHLIYCGFRKGKFYETCFTFLVVSRGTGWAKWRSGGTGWGSRWDEGGNLDKSVLREITKLRHAATLLPPHWTMGTFHNNYRGDCQFGHISNDQITWF